VTADGLTEPSPPSSWDESWDSHREAQLDAWCRTTPAQRLAWLEAAMDFAREAILREKRASVTKW